MMAATIDHSERLRALTDHESTLVVEASAGAGKTSLIAGRITMLLAEGCPPREIAAITFMEAAASDLSARVHRYVAELLDGQVPQPLRIALPTGLSTTQRARLEMASSRLNELTASTIHGFCQAILCAFAIEASIDPGARVIDATQGDIVFNTVFEHWFRRRLSAAADNTDPIAILARVDPTHVLTTVRELAGFRREHRTARPIAADLSGRPDIELVDAVYMFKQWFDRVPQLEEMRPIVTGLCYLAAHYEGSFASTPDFSELWRLAHPPYLRTVMLSDESFELKVPKLKAAWLDFAGKDERTQLNEQALEHFGRVDAAYRVLLGKVATALVAALSNDLDEVLYDYATFKRAAAMLDFDDLLHSVRDLLVGHEEVRVALGNRYPRILVDEFQDTDPLQAEILFRIGAVTAPSHWEEAKLRDGSLVFVGDPKQAIFGFRGADIEACERAKMAIPPENHVSVTANFRSLPDILSHVNQCFAAPLRAAGQPGYIDMISARDPRAGGLPGVAKLTIQFHECIGAPRAHEVRIAEADQVAWICSRLVGNVRVTIDDGQTRPLKLSDIALLTPSDTQLWRYEQALDDYGLPYASQAGKNLLDRQETRDMLAVARVLADPNDTLAFGTLMRGPLVGLSEQELLDITEQLPAGANIDQAPRFSLRTDPEDVTHEVARHVLTILRDLWRASRSTTPKLILSEAIERLSMRSILAIRDGERSNRALANIDLFLEIAQSYDVRGMKQLVTDLMRDWTEEEPRTEGRVEASGDAVQIVTMHSAKGLEWPVVILINTVTRRRPRDAFVHRSSDDTLHWVLKDVVPPDLHVAMQTQDAKDARERERLYYYVAFTRARDLLVVPKIPNLDDRTWSSTVQDPHRGVLELDLSKFTRQALPSARAEPNGQSAEVFAQQQAVLSASRRPISWIRPSLDDLDRVPASDLLVAQDADPSETPLITGAGRIRGLLLHKLMEEVLTGELSDEVGALAARATELIKQLSQGPSTTTGPLEKELAMTIQRTLAIPEIAALRPGLTPEVDLYGAASVGDGVFVSGRVDAFYVENSQPRIAVDWKSDVDPSTRDIENHSAQLYSYMKTSGAVRGVLVYMSTSQLCWLDV